jgi:hypothetical protein
MNTNIYPTPSSQEPPWKKDIHQFIELSQIYIISDTHV